MSDHPNKRFFKPSPSLTTKEVVLLITILLMVSIAFAYFTTTPTKPDKELYFAFYKDIMARSVEVDNKIKPFQKAVADRDPLKAISIASDIDNDVSQLWSKLQGVVVPDLKNKEAQKELEKAKTYLSNAYFNKSEALSAFVEYSFKEIKRPSYNL